MEKLRHAKTCLRALKLVAQRYAYLAFLCGFSLRLESSAAEEGETGPPLRYPAVGGHASQGWARRQPAELPSSTEEGSLGQAAQRKNLLTR